MRTLRMTYRSSSPKVSSYMSLPFGLFLMVSSLETPTVLPPLPLRLPSAHPRRHARADDPGHLAPATPANPNTDEAGKALGFVR